MKCHIEARPQAPGTAFKPINGSRIPSLDCQLVTERQLAVKFALQVFDSGK